MTYLIPHESIERRIYVIHGQKVMLDRDLADLYGVKTSVLNQAVIRNRERFPEDFMFSLSRQEILRISQFVISFSGQKNDKLKFAKNVNVFTEQGIAMLSGILNSHRAIQVNIAIMRAFVNLRQIMANNKNLARMFKELEGRVDKNDSDIRAIFGAIRKMLTIEEKPKRKIGFQVPSL